MNTIDLRPIPATSPTLAQAMRACQLRAGLLKDVDVGSFVLGNPKAWLGTAYHHVLENVGRIESAADGLGSTLELLWNGAIETQYVRMMSHALDRRFGMPTTWPGYYVAKASAILRARELASVQTGNGGASFASCSSCPETNTPIRERRFSAFDGKLVGKPDVIRGREVVDYKTGVILEHDDATQTGVVRASYVRQLRIYGFLVKETLGWWPDRGVLLPLAGAGVEVELTPEECTREAAEAVELLDSYNSKLQMTEPSGLASPSPENCKWCPFKIVCRPFWDSITSEWSGNLDGEAVEGIVQSPVRTIHAGAAVAVTVAIQVGSETPREVNISPLAPGTHAAATSLSAGDRIRCVGLRGRPDGTVVPTQRTVICKVTDMPAISTSEAARS